MSSRCQFVRSVCIPALPDRGCELWFAVVQESIVKDEVNIFLVAKNIS